MSKPKLLVSFLSLILAATTASGETIRVAIGTQDTTINCATGGLVIRELKLLEKYLPHTGKYQNAKYDIIWKNFTSGPPLTNEMVANKLDLGSMADFPGALNIAAFRQAGKQSVFITVLSGSTQGTGNGIVVPNQSPIQSFTELKGKTISVPFGSSAHGMLLRAIAAQGWDAEREVSLLSQSPEVGGTSLRSNKIDAHADFVPFAELFPFRGFARKIYDGSQANAATFHGTLVNQDFAQKYPEIVVAFLRAALEANRLVSAQPERFSELIAKITGIEAEVNYLFHGPLGLQTRDYTWKPEYRRALQTSIETLRLLKKTEARFTADSVIDDRYLRLAFQQAGIDYEAQLKSYKPLAADPKGTQPVVDPLRAAQLWLQGEPQVQTFAAPELAFIALQRAQAAGKKPRVVYVHDRNTGLKLLAKYAWYVRADTGELNAFLLRDAAQHWAETHGGNLLPYAGASTAASALTASTAK